MPFLCRRIQFAVGQGAFHATTIHWDGSLYRYVYDCGSFDEVSLQREIAAYVAATPRTPLDLLCLSHLHYDHVSGIERLFRREDVDTVVLPYLHPYERIALAVGDSVAGRLTGTRFALLAEPATWFRERGARRVAFVLPSVPPAVPPAPGPRGGEPPPPDAPPKPLAPDDFERRRREDHAPRLGVRGFEPLRQEHRNLHPGLPAPAGDLFVVSPGNRLELTRGIAPVWELLPFTHPDPARQWKLVATVAHILGMPRPPSAFDPHFFRLLREGVLKRKSQLTSAYKKVFGYLNRSSMSLYSGIADGELHDWTRPAGHATGARHAWLGTGDTELLDRERAEAFERFFRTRLPLVSTFVLPHHGSRHNFSPRLFEGLLHDVDWVATYGRNDYGHPSRRLLEGLRKRGRILRVQRWAKRRFGEDLVGP